ANDRGASAGDRREQPSFDTGLNQQILINDGFNKSFTSLRNSILRDREVVAQQLRKVEDEHRGTTNYILAQKQFFKVQHLRNKVRAIAESVANAKIGMISHSDNPEEVQIFGIDLEKIENLRSTLIEWTDGRLSIVIKVPSETTETTQNDSWYQCLTRTSTKSNSR
ncbi:hypothetical protein EVAR_70439_1, partial [Eumeta japonica]